MSTIGLEHGGVVRVPLTHGHSALVSTEDHPAIRRFSWICHHDYTDRNRMYAIARGDDGRKVALHRVILGITDPQVAVDHVNGDGLDNRRQNLRACTTSQNNANRRKTSGFTSQYLGVSRHPIVGWVMQTRKRDVGRIIMYFTSEVSAAIAYNQAASQLHGAFARLNRLPFVGDAVAIRPTKARTTNSTSA